MLGTSGILPLGVKYRKWQRLFPGRQPSLLLRLGGGAGKALRLALAGNDRKVGGET